MMATDRDFTGPVNVGNPTEITVLELAELILRIAGGRAKLVFKPLPEDDPKQRRPDITLARTRLGWEPKVALEDGLKETIAYFRRALAA
jgi:UDP-glucuronate decarboxylase